MERDKELCRILERRFRGLHVLQGDALQSKSVLALAGIQSVCVALSGLPMRAVPTNAAASYYTDLFQVMPEGGAIIQYTYGFRPPVDPHEVDLRPMASFIGREWRNVPPMGIWRYQLTAYTSDNARLLTRKHSEAPA
jgi:phosphatidylethanolamine/phosphatidyl-N-methylethanolamine N-methyltransferase